MANLTVKDPPEFTKQIHKTEEEDYITAELENTIKEALLNNDVFLKLLVEKIKEKSEEHIGNEMIHVTTEDKKSWSGKAETAIATQTKDGLESAADKRKLDGVANGAEVNQNAFSNVKIGNVTVSANGKTATFTLEAGSNVTIHADNASKKIVITANRDGGNADMVDGYHAEHFAAADHGHDGRYYTKTESDNLLNQKAANNHNHNGGKYLAGQGVNGGYSFANDGSYDTGMFSDADGDLYFMCNGQKWRASHDDHNHNENYLPYLSGLTTGYVTTGQKTGTTVGRSATAEGRETQANGDDSHAEGFATQANGDYSHAEGSNTIASGSSAHVEGYVTKANGNYSHAEGWNTQANGERSHAEGNSTTASSYNSHAEGSYTTASGDNSHAEGYYTSAASYQHVLGTYNVVDESSGSIGSTARNAFIVGRGTSNTSRSNAFSVMFNGTVKAASTITASTAADYAEFFEWLDSNPEEEDRVGHFVTLEGTKIRYATSQDDYILGIISGQPFVLGNGDCDTWNGMYLRDAFNRTIQEPAPKIEMVDITEEMEREIPELDEKTGEIIIKTVKETVVVDSIEKEVFDENGNPVYEGTRAKLNPKYNPNEKYISRFERHEWDAVGMLGVLSVYDDGTCEVNGYCRCNDSGIATKSESGYRVIERITENIVKVVFR